MIFTITLNPALDRTLSVPSLEINQVIRATAVNLDWGGKGFNVSRALKFLGGESIALGYVGGSTGNLLQNGLASIGIANDFVHIADETRTNIVLMEVNSSKHIKVNEPGPIICQEEQQQLLNKVRILAQKGDLWALCGSLPPGIPNNFYAQLIKIIQQNGGHAFLDTSGNALQEGLLAHPFMIKPNREEAEEVLGISLRNKEDLLDAAIRFHGLGIPWVALSCGAEGLLLSNKRRAIFAPAPVINVANTVGAGDALLAGIIWAFNEGKNQAEIAAWGVASGSASAMLAGVNFAFQSDIQELMNGIIKEVSKL